MVPLYQSLLTLYIIEMSILKIMHILKDNLKKNISLKGNCQALKCIQRFSLHNNLWIQSWISLEIFLILKLCILAFTQKTLFEFFSIKISLYAAGIFCIMHEEFYFVRRRWNFAFSYCIFIVSWKCVWFTVKTQFL